MAVSHVYNQTVADGTATSVVRPSDWNSAHNQFMTLAGNTAGVSTVSGTNIIFQGGNNVTLSGNANTIVFSAANAAQVTLNNWRIIQSDNNTAFSTLGQNSVELQHFIAEQNVIFSTIEFYGRGTIVSSSGAQTFAQTLDYGLYSQGTGASTSIMSLMSSSQMLMTHTMNSTSANGLTMAVGGTTFTSTTNNTSMMSGLTGFMHFYLPFTGTLIPNNKYAVGIRMSTSTAGGSSGYRIIPMVQTIMTSNAGRLSLGGIQQATSTVIGDRELGIYSTTSGALPATYATSQLGIGVNRHVLPLNFEVS